MSFFAVFSIIHQFEVLCHPLQCFQSFAVFTMTPRGLLPVLRPTEVTSLKDYNDRHGTENTARDHKVVGNTASYGGGVKNAARNFKSSDKGVTLQ